MKLLFSLLIVLVFASNAEALQVFGGDPLTTSGDLIVGGNLDVNGDGPHSIFANLTGTGPKVGLSYDCTVDMTSGDAICYDIDITDTASPGLLYGIRVRVGGVERLLVDTDGILTATGGLGIRQSAGPAYFLYGTTSGTIGLNSLTQLKWAASTDAKTGVKDIGIVRVTSGVLKVTNGDSGDGTLKTGGFRVAFRNVSTNNSPVTVAKNDYSFDCNAAVGDVTFKLMSSSLVPGQGFEFTTVSTGKCILQASGGDNINGFNTYTSLNTPGESCLIRSNGINRWTIKYCY